VTNPLRPETAEIEHGLAQGQPTVARGRPRRVFRATFAPLFGAGQRVLLEWSAILLVGILYCYPTLLNRDPLRLSQAGEHPESATLPLLAEIGLKRYGEIPLWNPYMLTGFPHAGDFVNHFWNPVSTVPILLFGGINGMKFSVVLSFLIAGWGQWFFAHVFGLRGIARLWSALLFLVSGGLALLWRVGWYELLLGAVWFPWCIASLWWAIRRRDRTSIALAALPIAIVLTSGGGYYPFYLFGTLSLLVLLAVLLAPADARWLPMRRAVGVALLTAALVAVVTLPWIDSYRMTARDASPERDQSGSQSIPYALINYIVYEPSWFGATILGTKGGWNWFYIGWLPLAGAALAPLAFRSRRARAPILVLASLTLLLLAWHANRHTPFKYVYDLVPWLYNLRFVGRLLIVATIPLLGLAGWGVRHVQQQLGRWGERRAVTIPENGKTKASSISLKWIVLAPFFLVLLFSVRNVYKVNKGFALLDGRLDPKSIESLSFLRRYDRGLYYTNIGGGYPEFKWTPAAYMLEMPIINFQYNRRLTSQDKQRSPDSPFFASAKYILARPDQPIPADAKSIRTFGGDWTLWHDPNALPFAFTAARALLQSGAPVRNESVRPAAVQLVGPNQVTVRAVGDSDRDLVVLVSDYPGWKLFVDDRSASVRPVNGYLGAAMRPGEHAYRFVYRPRSYQVGLVISVLAVIAVCVLILADLRSRAGRPSPVPAD
jgi:hypothetical protein